MAYPSAGGESAFPAKKDSHALNIVFNRIDLIHSSLEKGNPPYKDGKPYRKCRKCDSATAIKCPFNEECWSLKNETKKSKKE